MHAILQECPLVMEVPVLWGEMDALQHVNNTVYFRYFENARIAYFEKLAVWDYMKRTGIGPILASTQCRFKIPLTYPDTVSIGTKVSDIGLDRLTMEYYVVSHKHQQIAAEGNGLIVIFNYHTNKKTELPTEIKERILAFTV